MSLHVNLILDSERRSGSDVSMKFALRAGLIFLGALLALGISVLVLGARGARRERIAVEGRQKDLEPVYEAVVQIRADLTKLQSLVNLLEGWRTNRLTHSGYLCALQLCVPADIQLTRLTMQDNLHPGAPEPHRSGNVYLRGRAAGQNADAAVRLLHAALKSRPPFDVLMDAVEVKRFTADVEQADEDVRIFEMEGRFIKRNIVLRR